MHWSPKSYLWCPADRLLLLEVAKPPPILTQNGHVQLVSNRQLHHVLSLHACPGPVFLCSTAILAPDAQVPDLWLFRGRGWFRAQSICSAPFPQIQVVIVLDYFLLPTPIAQGFSK